MTLKECKTRAEVEKFFTKSEAVNMNTKITFLMEAMNNPQLFSSNGKPTEEQRYEMLMATFLSGRWRYADSLRSLKTGK